MKRYLTVFAALVCLVQAGAARAERNACELLTEKDIAAVQGEAFTDTKLTGSKEGALDISQCFFQLPNFSKSVSVMVMRPAPGSNGDAVRAYWKSRIESEGEEEQKTLRIHGVGKEALWSGNRITGALYVVDRDAILRISVGGPGSQEQRIAKSKRLAARALRRL